MLVKPDEDGENGKRSREVQNILSFMRCEDGLRRDRCEQRTMAVVTTDEEQSGQFF